MESKHYGLIEIHVAVVLFGFAGLFGKLLTIGPVAISFGRTVFAAAALWGVLKFTKASFRVGSIQGWIMLTLIGALLTIHWLAFFRSIEVSTVAIGLLTLSTFPLFVTFLEPYFFKERLRGIDVATMVAAFLGVALIVPSFDLSNHLTEGALWGMFSGFTYAWLSLLNRRVVKTYSPMFVSFFQNCVVAILLLPFIVLTPPTILPKDILLLGVLGLAITAVPSVLLIRSYKHIRVQLASVITTLEAVYGIVFAFLILGEIPSVRTLSGGAVIIGAIGVATYFRKRDERAVIPVEV